jgi:hypothetical protein
MEFHAYHGASLEHVRDAYTRPQRTEDEDPAELRRFHLDLQPSTRGRGKGAHQLGSKTFLRRFNDSKGPQLVIAVKNTNRWDTPGAKQEYALAVVLERDHDHTPLYAELRARLEAIAEIELEAEG